jgi:hypothetical protein
MSSQHQVSVCSTCGAIPCKLLQYSPLSHSAAFLEVATSPLVLDSIPFKTKPYRVYFQFSDPVLRKAFIFHQLIAPIATSNKRKSYLMQRFQTGYTSASPESALRLHPTASTSLSPPHCLHLIASTPLPPLHCLHPTASTSSPPPNCLHPTASTITASS